MALKIRRGLEAERAALTGANPAAGEPIFVTDTGKLYVGNGVQTGGVIINPDLSIGNLTDVNSSISPATNQLLTWTGSQWDAVTLSVVQDIQDLNNVNVTGVANGKILKYNAVLNNPDGSTGGWVVGDEAFSSFDLDATLAGKSVGVFGDFAMTGLNVPADGQYLLWDDANGYWKPGDINLASGAIQSISADVTGSVFGDDSTLLVDGVNSKVLLNNGVTNIVDDTVTSTTALFNISNPTEATNTVMNIWNQDNNSAIRIQSLNGSGSGQVSGIAFNGYYGGLPNLDGSLGGSEVKGTAGSYVAELIATAFDPDFGDGTKVVSSGIAFRLDPNGTIANDQAPGQIEFFTNAGTNTLPDLKGMVFDSAGQLAINRTSARATLDVSGIALLEPQAAAPTTPVIGMIAVANKVDWDPASSAGSTPYPVFYNGSAWESMV
jgi:hypothetical protein